MENPTLPHDLIAQILLKLPVRSLLRFKSVCKSWLSLISDPQFAKSHFDLAASVAHLRLLLCEAPINQIKSMDIDASLYDDSALVKLDSALVKLNSHTPHEAIDFEIIGSCRGFIVLSIDYEDDLIVWNPSTGVHKRISEYAIGLGPYLHGIGYDSSTDDYFIVLIALDDFEIQLDNWQPRIEFFSLKTNSCYNIQGVNLRYMAKEFNYRNDGLYFNETLHWLAISHDTKLLVIIALNLIERSLSEIAVPHDLAMQSTSGIYSLKIMRGCLSLCSHGPMDWGARTEIWIMKEYKLQSSWTKSFVLSSHDNFPYNYFFPLCFTEDGEVLGSNTCGRLMKLDDTGKLIEQCTEGLKYDFHLLHSGIYRESLLALPGNSEKTSKNHQYSNRQHSCLF